MTRIFRAFLVLSIGVFLSAIQQAVQLRLLTNNEGDGSFSNSNGDERAPHSTVVSTTNHTIDNFRILLGIFSTMNSDSEFQRRQEIRDTYLDFYHWQNTHFQTTDSQKICSLSDLKSNPSQYKNCRLVYTFVVGAHPPESTDKPAEILANGNERLVLDNYQIASATNEPDITYLNIRENMNDGKSISYFRYVAFELLPDENLEIDFVAKMDTDTLLFPDKFLDLLTTDLSTVEKSPHESLNSLPPLVYGGFYIREWLMRGELYYLSRNLVNYIVDCTATVSECVSIPSQLLRGRYKTRIEDMEIAMYVDTYKTSFQGDTVHRIGHPKRSAWEHPMKDSVAWHAYWDYALYITHLRHLFSKDECPSQLELMQKIHQWKDYPELRQRFLQETLC